MSTIISGTTGVSMVQDGIVTDAKLSLSANSQEIKDALNATGTAPIYGVRAWVNFDATRNAAGGTDSANTNRFIRASGNVASVLKNGTGDYTITFTTAMPDANYLIIFNTIANRGAGVHGGYTPVAGSVRVANQIPASSAFEDVTYCDVMIIR